MYLTIKDTAELLSMPETYVESLIHEKRIRAIYDGDIYLINKEQFNTHFEQLEKYKQFIEEINSEPIPEDIDVKDED
ncbi:MAG TPA: excisionase family DNA-binding protein [Bacillus bacterium]|nr:excisionase family DNA-binding protein [Bacillus sp. (in: firmicutes)]